MQRSDLAFRDYNTNGVAGSGAYKPVKSTIRAMVDDVVPFHSIMNWLSDAERDQVIANGTTLDLAASIGTALADMLAAGGGTLFFPRGTYAITTVAFSWTSSTTINLRGAGEKATILKKHGASSSPILNLSSPTSILDIYSTISDMWVQGSSKVCDGVKCTNIASLTTRNLMITACDVGFSGLGCLVSLHHKAAWNSNNTGYKCVKSADSIYSNLVQFYSCVFNANTSLGADIGDASGFCFIGCNFELNGTTDVTTTGAVSIRNTVDDETGYSLGIFENCHLEANLGLTFNVAAAGGLDLILLSTLLLADEDGRALTVGAIRSLTLDNVQIPTASPIGIATLAASTCTIRNSIFGTLTDTSVSRQYTNVTTSAGGLYKNASSGMGTATLVAGAVTVSYSVGTNEQILVTSQSDGGTPGFLRVTAKVGSTSFTVTSSNGADTSTIAWFAMRPLT